MAVPASVLRELAELALGPEQMAGVLRIIATMAEADEARKVKDRERKRRGNSAEIPRNLHGNGAEIPAVVPPKEKSPTPPKEITPSPDANASEKPTTRVRATRLPADFEPDVDEALALGLGLDRAISEAANFRDYWRSKPTNNTKLDWPATWRVWCRKAANEPQRRGGRGPPGEKNGFSEVWKELNGGGHEPEPHDYPGPTIDASPGGQDADADARRDAVGGVRTGRANGASAGQGTGPRRAPDAGGQVIDLEPEPRASGQG